jgi:putative ATP-dependent endonuclease of the OLD family
MRISRVWVENYRCLKNCDMHFDQLTAIVGENNAGKSAFLKAIDCFFGSSSSLAPEDYFGGNTAEPVSITIEFCDLTPNDREEFAEHLIADKVTITREFVFGEARKEAGKFYATSFVFPGFDEIRKAQSENDRKAAYRKVSEELEGDLLPKVTKGAEIEENLVAWEAAFVHRLESRRKGRAFGFANVALGKLNAAVAFHLIPAVEDALNHAGFAGGHFL